jgi:hypothetical protein
VQLVNGKPVIDFGSLSKITVVFKEPDELEGEALRLAYTTMLH